LKQRRRYSIAESLKIAFAKAEEGFADLCRPDSVPELPERLKQSVDDGHHGQMADGGG
jgi:hypothetical protein